MPPHIVCLVFSIYTRADSCEIVIKFTYRLPKIRTGCQALRLVCDFRQRLKKKAVKYKEFEEKGFLNLTAVSVLFPTHTLLPSCFI